MQEWTKIMTISTVLQLDVEMIKDHETNTPPTLSGDTLKTGLPPKAGGRETNTSRSWTSLLPL